MLRTTTEPLSAQVARKIEAMVLAGGVLPGAKLPAERALSEQLDVSRTAVREAIRLLEQRGLVDVQPGRGIFVARRTTDSISRGLELMVKIEEASFTHLLEARYHLEVPAARLAALRRTNTNVERLGALVAQMEGSLWDVIRFREADQAFHLELAVATQNPLFSIWIQPVLAALDATRRGVAALPPVRERIVRCHREIFTAVEAGDTARAAAGMRAHLAQFADDTFLAADLGMIRPLDADAADSLRAVRDQMG
ncbi:MAG: FadR family transcriptional regulator [Chloroflexi bacterium]|nr:FadR family transcriptional regulator [Chloroflexota bacterium]